MAYQHRNRRRTVLILLLLTAVTLVTLDQRGGGGVIGTARDGARDVLAPVQDAFGGITAPLGRWFDGIVEGGEIRSENEELRREVEELRGELTRAEAALFENEELRGLLDLDWVGDVPVVPAEVVNVAVGNFEATVQIDRGSDDGVEVGMPVVAGEGLVGHVSQASRRRATVLLISASDSGVGARLADSRAAGIARGTGAADELRLEFIDPEVAVADGELVVTSGVDASAYPPDLQIGRVVGADQPRGALEQDIAVAPLVDLDHLQFLAVLRWLPDPGDG